jgi:hypothetical protein
VVVAVDKELVAQPGLAAAGKGKITEVLPPQGLPILVVVVVVGIVLALQLEVRMAVLVL